MSVPVVVGRGHVVGFAVAGLVLVGAASLMFARQTTPVLAAEADSGSKSVVNMTSFQPTASQWAALTIEPVEGRLFRSEFTTEGKIAVNDDSSTPVFSPYAGRVTRIAAKPGDRVERGQALFVVEATDTVQSLNDYVTAHGAFNTARSKLKLAEIVEKRANDLYAGKAVPLKDWQQAQADLASAQNDMRSTETGAEAARNRLRILGLSDAAIASFLDSRQIKPDTSIEAPIAGTVVQRKLGPGQYLASGATDPAFVIGDLSTVWLTAFVRETDAASLHPGQDVTFAVLAVANRVFQARINYIASAFDPVTRRLLIRATVDNKDGLLRPEMFASVTLYSETDSALSPAVPLRAPIYEGDTARLWVARDGTSLELRQVRLGLTNGDRVQVLDGLRIGERVVAQGSLFIDRAANGS
jgi:cobalt-zinc-cadmium efflux system membrane fusion protein